MKAVFRIAKPDDVEATISLTLTLAQWKELRKVLTDQPLYGPAGKLGTTIDDLTRQATRTFYPETPDEEAA